MSSIVYVEIERVDALGFLATRTLALLLMEESGDILNGIKFLIGKSLCLKSSLNRFPVGTDPRHQ